MENIIALLGGLVLGGLGGYASVRAVFRKQISEANSKSDITLKEAELTAKRKIDEAEIQAKKSSQRRSKPTKTLNSKKFRKQRKNLTNSNQNLSRTKPSKKWP